MKLKVAVLVSLCVVSGAQAGNKPGSGMNLGKCEVLWVSISPSGAPISKDAFPPTADFTVIDTDSNGSIDAGEFLEGCKSGLIRIAR